VSVMHQASYSCAQAAGSVPGYNLSRILSCSPLHRGVVAAGCAPQGMLGTATLLCIRRQQAAVLTGR